MGFSRIRLYNYRNLQDAEVHVDAPQVFLVGENGQGKTNFLESVYLLCFGSSFRARLDRDMIRHGESEMSVAGWFSVPESGRDQTVSVKFSGSRKHLEVNGKNVQDRKEIIENIPCIVFCHEDIEFVTGPPERRRWFFNQTMSLHTSLFIDLLRRYRKIVSMRNAAIKDEQTVMLSVYDEQAAAVGLEIQKQRVEAIRDFNETFSPLFERISGLTAPLQIRYSPSWPNDAELDDVVEFLREKRNTDYLMRTTTSGPHRDRITFVAAGRNFAETASTGQQRLISLVLRVAQAAYFSQITGRKPVLLLDDVLLELDSRRRRKFLEVLPEAEQAYFTFLPDEQYHLYKSVETLVFTVKQGVLTEAE